MGHEVQQRESRQNNSNHREHTRQKDKYQNRVIERKSRRGLMANTIRENITDTSEVKANTMKRTNHQQLQQKNIMQGPSNMKQRVTPEYQAQQIMTMLYTQMLPQNLIQQMIPMNPYRGTQPPIFNLQFPTQMNTPEMNRRRPI